MGRPERPVDPGAGPVQLFAYELRQVRRDANNPSYRQMARQVHYSITALSEAAGGEKLPSWPVARAYVQACGGDLAKWEVRWRSAEEALRSSGVESDTDWLVEPVEEAPYRGLSVFQPEDAQWYFGREELVDELVARLGREPFVAVFGASGSGKSSLLRAGLLPAVRAGRVPGGQGWPSVLMTPGSHPLAELAVQVAALRGISPGSLRSDLEVEPGTLDLALRQVLVTVPSEARVLVIVDQFEEVFTLCSDPVERDRFVEALLSAVTSTSGAARLVLGIRADFYGRCAEYPALVAALVDHQVLIGPMNSEQLRRAIVEPASQAGLRVEPALVQLVITDVQGRPGALPLLSHALRETWRRRRGNTLTVANY